VSKRHQSTRRRSYARRQHEVQERADRRLDRGQVELDREERFDGLEIDPLAFLDPRTLRARYAFGD
jgi:hypothetical protein